MLPEGAGFLVFVGLSLYVVNMLCLLCAVFASCVPSLLRFVLSVVCHFYFHAVCMCHPQEGIYGDGSIRLFTHNPVYHLSDRWLLYAQSIARRAHSAGLIAAGPHVFSWSVIRVLMTCRGFWAPDKIFRGCVL